MKHKDLINNLQYSFRSRNLPHKYDPALPIFITYRLKFTLPNSMKEELLALKKKWEMTYKTLGEKEQKEMLLSKDITFFYEFDQQIAKSLDVPAFLHREDLVQIIAQNFHHFDNQRYQLQAFCIMPNHVHILISPLAQADGDVFPLSHINYTWKRYTSNQINKVLSRNGSLWQDESYDHLIKSDLEFAATIRYIANNPVKAGLAEKWDEWYGTWIKDELISLVE
jgi:putative transposase